MSNICFTSRQQVIDFLKTRNIEDAEIQWICPVCKTKNTGAYYSHETKCGECDFKFPQLNLREILKDDDEATKIAEIIKKYKDGIDLQWEIIDDLENELLYEKRKLHEMQCELKEMMFDGKDKVKW